MVQKTALDWVALILLIIGGVNWGLVGLADINLVAMIADVTAPIIGTIVYSLVGLSALYTIYFLVKK